MTDLNVVDILLVEDNPNDAELTLKVLKESKLANKIQHVTDGEEALEYIFGTGRYEKRKGSVAPKLILLDLKLPKVDGIEVLARIRSDDRTKKIPVVFLTSSKEESDIVKAYNLGVNSYIVKPVQFEKFIEVIKKLEMYWLVINQSPVY